MISIAVTQRKGGVGKTTISTHMAAHWATMGHKVLLIDTDAQGDTGRMFGLKPTNGLYQLLVPDEETGEVASLDKVLKAIPAEKYSVPDNPPKGSLFLLPGSSKTAVIPSLTDNPFVFADQVDKLKEIFDVIVIDTSPTISALDAYVYLATDFYVFVTQNEPLSLKGLHDGITQVKNLAGRREKHMGSKNSVLKIVPNMMDARIGVHRMLMQELGKTYGEELLASPIMYRAKYKEASLFGQLVYAHAPSSQEAADMRQMATQIEGALEHVL